MDKKNYGNIFYISLLVIVFELIIIILLLSIIPPEQKKVITHFVELNIVLGAVISLFFTIAFYIITGNKPIKDTTDILHDNIEKLTEIKDRMKTCSNLVIRKMKTEEEYILKYEQSRSKDNSDNKSYFLTSFSIYPSDLTSMEVATGKGGDKYIENELIFCQESGEFNAHIKRIISIHSTVKFYVTRKIIEKASDKKDLTNNLQIAYLNLKNYEGLSFVPEVIGAQVFYDELYLMNPEFACISQHDNTKLPFLIKSLELASVFEEYYENILHEISQSNDPQQLGVILYNGGIAHTIEEKTWEKIYMNIPDKYREPSSYSEYKAKYEK